MNYLSCVYIYMYMSLCVCMYTTVSNYWQHMGIFIDFCTCCCAVLLVDVNPSVAHPQHGPVLRFPNEQHAYANKPLWLRHPGFQAYSGS